MSDWRGRVLTGMRALPEPYWYDNSASPLAKAIAADVVASRSASHARSLDRLIAAQEAMGASPIETMMLAALLVAGCRWTWCAFNAGEEWFVPYPSRLPLPLSEQWAAHVDGGLLVVAQAPVGKYTADFMLTCKTWAIPPDRELARVVEATVVVECDGHDFHERTKEQAKHDRERDRAMQLAGHVVLRYPGSVVWADALRCAQESIDGVHAVAEAKASVLEGK